MDNETLKTILDLQKRVAEYEISFAVIETMIVEEHPILIENTGNSLLNNIYDFLYNHFENNNKL